MSCQGRCRSWSAAAQAGRIFADKNSKPRNVLVTTRAWDLLAQIDLDYAGVKSLISEANRGDIHQWLMLLHSGKRFIAKMRAWS